MSSPDPLLGRYPLRCVAAVFVPPAYSKRCSHRASTLAPVSCHGARLTLPVCGTHARVAFGRVRALHVDYALGDALAGSFGGDS